MRIWAHYYVLLAGDTEQNVVEIKLYKRMSIIEWVDCEIVDTKSSSAWNFIIACSSESILFMRNSLAKFMYT